MVCMPLSPSYNDPPAQSQPVPLCPFGTCCTRANSAWVYYCIHTHRKPECKKVPFYSHCSSEIYRDKYTSINNYELHNLEKNNLKTDHHMWFPLRSSMALFQYYTNMAMIKARVIQFIIEMNKNSNMNPASIPIWFLEWQIVSYK